MRNPLHKRLPRELIGEAAKYLVIFLFMTGTIGFISGFLVAGGSMLNTYDQSFEKYNIEDGHFTLSDEINNNVIHKIENHGVNVYKGFYSDEPTDHNIDGTEDSTLRIYGQRDEINKVCVMKGEMPKNKSEIAIDRMYADNNDIEVGNTISVRGHQLKVSGLVALSDYSALFSDNSEIMFDAIKFGVSVMTEDGFDQFSKEHLKYNYFWTYNTKPSNDVQEKTKSEDLLKNVVKEVSSAKISIDEFVPQYLNQAIHFAGDDMGKDKSMMTILLYILIVILAFVFSVTVRHTIVKESSVIGTLRASGYTKKEIFAHYITVPIAVTLIASVVGNVLGYTLFKQAVAELYYGSYSLPTYETIWNGDAFVRTTIIPLVIMFATNAYALLQKLSFSPLQFLRKDLTRKKRTKAIRLPRLQFFSRFRIRIILQNASSYVTLFVGILFSGVLLMFGMMMAPLLTNYKDHVVNNMISKYQYILTTQVETDNTSAEKFCLTSLSYHATQRDEDFSIYGIEKNSKYFKETIPEGSVVISDGISEKYKIHVGDTIECTEKYGKKKYEFHVANVVSYPSGLAVFMSDDMFRDTFDFENSVFDIAQKDPGLFMKRLFDPNDSEYFTGYFSNEKLTDLEPEYIDSCITQDDMTKLSRQLDVSMGTMFSMINVFAIILATILIYLLTKLIIEKNTTAISMVKILGYENGEIARLYLLATTWIVLVSVVISLVFSTLFMKIIYRSFMMQFNGWLSCYIAPKIYPMMFGMMMVAYLVVALLQFRRIKKIPMDEALKNVE